MEQNRLERMTAVIHSFDKLVFYMYYKQNTRLSISIRNHNQNVNWYDIMPLFCSMMCGRQLGDMPMSNLSEVFGDGQRQNYDSVGAYLEELFKRCEKFSRQEKLDFYISRFKFFARYVLCFALYELGFCSAFINRNPERRSWSQIITFTLLELGSIACLVCSFVFTWGIFANVLFSAIFLCRALFYSALIMKSGLRVYRTMQENEIAGQKEAITSFDKNKGSIKKLIKRIGELERRHRLQNELVQRERQQSVVTNNVKSDINDVPLMVIAEGKVETI